MSPITCRATRGLSCPRALLALSIGAIAAWGCGKSPDAPTADGVGGAHADASGGSGGAATGGGGAAGAGTGGAAAGGAGGAPAGAGGATGAGGERAAGAGGATGTGGARATGGATGAGGERDAGATAPDAGGADTGGWTLVWSDEFDTDGPPNPANWGFEKGFVRNEELQWYQPDNATVKNGLLVIQAQRQQVANPNYNAGSSDWKQNRQYAQYTSSSMTTSGKHDFQYGRYEMRARIDTRQGSWPAFWTLGSATSWPQSGEVDIMEYYASKVLANVCAPAASTGYTCNWQSKSQALSSLGSDWSSQFHVWAMEWDAQKIDLYLDDQLVNHFVVPGATPSGVTNPFTTKKMYILVNLAIGANGGDPTNTTFPITYEVDYVRVYQK
jgi:beta-glucanase (GH16 family)